MTRHFSIRVSGKVQGVFFRASTKEKADELGIKGFVRNERDGSVYVEAEGDDEMLQRFIAWCNQGPMHAVVRKVEILEERVQGFSEFVISR